MRAIRHLLTFALCLLSRSGFAGTPQTITFPAIPDQISTATAFALGATVSSGLPVTYRIVSPAGVATLSGSTVNLSGTAGSVTVKASQAGDDNFDPAADAYRTFAVGLAGRRFVKLARGTNANHSLGIRADGTLWAWGSNIHGQLGDGTTATRLDPKQIGGGSDWFSGACGWYHTAAIKTDGTLWAWGYNSAGQLGDGTTSEHLSPVRVGTAGNWADVACGPDYTMAVKADGTLWAWGDNTQGELGISTYARRTSPVQVGSASNWATVACGYFHTMAVKTDGTLWAWGGNSSGQFGNGTNIGYPAPARIGNANNWAAVACGVSHTVAVKTDDTLWAWGDNGWGQLGDGTIGSNRLSPVQVGSASNWSSIACGSAHTAAVKTDGTLWAWGGNYYAQIGDGSAPANRSSPVQVDSANLWVAATCGQEHTLAVRTDGTLWAWGRNSSGQLGDGNVSYRTSPVQVNSPGNWTAVACGQEHSAALRTDGTLWAWGNNYFGQLGEDTAFTDRIIPVQVGSAGNWAAVACGSFHTAAVKTDGTLWTWGRNHSGQLGIGTTATSPIGPVRIGSASNWAAVACGYDHTMALKTDGTLWAWGNNNSGQLGDATTTDRPAPVQAGSDSNWASVVCGSSHTAAVKTDGTFCSWGNNSFGQLGDGTTVSRSMPLQVTGAANWADAGASGQTVSVRTDGTLWAWGYNFYGQLGDGTRADRAVPVQVGNSGNWAAVACAWYHTTAVKTDGTLWAWGQNSSGQLGDGTTFDHPSPVQAGSASDWSAVACGTLHNVAVKSDGSLWAWGDNSSGQLGIGARWTPSRSWPARAPQWITSLSFDSLFFGQAVVLDVSASSGLPVIYTVAGPANLSGNVLTPTAPGTLTVTAYQSGDAAWQSAETWPQTVTVTSRDTPLSLFESTLTAAGLTGPDAAPAATPFDDNLPNLLKYAFNLSLTRPDAGTLVPGTGTGGLPAITLSGSVAVPVLRVEFLRRIGSGLLYTPEKIADLAVGPWVPLIDEPDVLPIDTQWERVIFEEQFDAAVSPQLFVRIQVTLP